jgi:hypothetical protein
MLDHNHACLNLVEITFRLLRRPELYASIQGLGLPFIIVEFTASINYIRILASYDNMVIWQKWRTNFPWCVTECRARWWIRSRSWGYLPDTPRPMAGPLCTAFVVPYFISRGAPRQSTWVTSVSEGWNYGREMSDQFCRNLASSTPNKGFFNVPQICDMGPTALLPLRRKACWGFFRPEKSDGFGRVWTRDLG